MDRNPVIETLNDLIETCKDGEQGFGTCAEHAESPQVRDVFQARAQDCREAARELQALVAGHGAEPEQHGSTLGAIERGWTAFVGTVAGHSDKRMLEAAERAEDSALGAYRKALKKELPPDVRMVVERQMAGVQRNHDQIRTLRDQARAHGNEGAWPCPRAEARSASARTRPWHGGPATCPLRVRPGLRRRRDDTQWCTKDQDTVRRGRQHCVGTATHRRRRSCQRNLAALLYEKGTDVRIRRRGSLLEGHGAEEPIRQLREFDQRLGAGLCVHSLLHCKPIVRRACLCLVSLTC